MTRSSSSNSYSPSVLGLLGVLFVGLKLTGHIGWPWVWVLAPFWIPIVIAVVFLLIAGIIVLIWKKY